PQPDLAALTVYRSGVAAGSSRTAGSRIAVDIDVPAPGAIPGDAFADWVVGEAGPGDDSGIRALGAPDGLGYVGDFPPRTFLFRDNVLVDGPGADLTVHRAGTEGLSTFDLSVSEDGQTFVPLSPVAVDAERVRFDYDIAGTGLTRVTAVRVLGRADAG